MDNPCGKFGRNEAVVELQEQSERYDLVVDDVDVIRGMSNTEVQALGISLLAYTQLLFPGQPHILTARQLVLLRLAVLYAKANSADINDTFEAVDDDGEFTAVEGKIDLGGERFDAVAEDEWNKLSGLLGDDG